MELLMIGFGILVLLGVMLSPFPYWPTYFRLWAMVLKGGRSWRTKYKQARFLLKVAVGAPVWGWLWLLDEILFPAYKKRKIDPVFIIGQPRCGTTLLHRTLATDDETFFAISHLEWRYPFIVVQKLIVLLKIDRWMERANYWPDSEAGKVAAKMHPNRLSDWEEDGIFFEENYLHHFFIFLRFPDPEQLAYLDSFTDLPERTRTKIIDVHQRVLQKVLYLRGPDHRLYLSKEVTSHNKIPFLLERYKDARFILTVRPADEFMSSLLALMRMSTEAKTGADPASIPGWNDAVLKRMRKDCLRLVSLCRNTIPKDRLIHVSANHYMQRINCATKEIYKALNIPPKQDFCDHLESLHDGQKRRNRGYTYDSLKLEGFEEYDQFVAEVREQFQEKIGNAPSERQDQNRA